MTSLAEIGPLALVGAGRMGGAMLAGWLERGLAPDSVSLIDPNMPPETRRLAEGHGVRTGGDVAGAAIVILAVKPQMMDTVLTGIAPRLAAGCLILSIAAGRTIASLGRFVGAERAIVRAMPNTPAAIGRGMTVAVGNAAVDARGRAAATALLAAVGGVEWVEDEGLIDAVTAVSGSGPAYVFWLTECLAEAGRLAGLPGDLAEKLARATASGAGALLDASDEPAATLRANVTSPGGTTQAALEILMAANGLQPLMTRAVAAAAARSRALAGTD